MRTTLYKISVIILILLPFCVLSNVFFKFAIDIPHWDDHALKAFQVNFNASGFYDRIRLIFAQHNEHRIALTRFFSLLIYEIKGGLDFRLLMILGNISLIGTTYIFYDFLKKYKLSLFYFIPIPFFIFGLQLHENLFWGMAAVQNFWVVFLGILSFYLLIFSQNKWGFYGAIISSFVAINTSGNGLLIPIIGLIICLLAKNKTKLKYWAIINCVFVLLYFYGYTSAPDATKTHIRLANLIYLPKAIFVYLGALADSKLFLPQFRENIAAITGAIIMLFFAYHTRLLYTEKYNYTPNKKNIFTGALILFCCGTALLVSVSRLGNTNDFGLLMGSKYKIYGTLSFIICYMIVLYHFDNKKMIGNIGIITSILICMYNYLLTYKEVSYTRQDRICDEFNWTYNPDATINSLLAYKIGQVYHPEKRFYAPYLSQIISKIDTNIVSNKLNFGTVQDSNTIQISFLLPNDMHTDNYLILRSDSYHYMFPIRNQASIFKNTPPTASMTVKIPKTSIKTAAYQLGVLANQGTQNTIEFSNKIFYFQGLTTKTYTKNW